MDVKEEEKKIKKMNELRNILKWIFFGVFVIINAIFVFSENKQIIDYLLGVGMLTHCILAIILFVWVFKMAE